MRGNNMDNVQERVINIVVKQLGVSKEKVTPEAHIINDLGADSLDTVELVMCFEDEFNLEIPDEYAGEVETIGQIIEYIKERAK